MTNISLWVQGFALSSLCIALTFVLEAFCQDDVRKLKASKGGEELYRAAIAANLRNVLVFGSLAYYITIVYVCTKNALTFSQQASSVFGIVLVEGFFYYAIHRAFHEVRSLWWMHKFHHQFHAVVLPSSASAVSVGEFVFAYMMPIIVGAMLTQADAVSAVAAATIITISNLWIHTPFLQEIKLPWMFVSTSDHLNHHRRGVRGDYGAPVFHFDRILRVAQKGSKQSAET
eukprot:CAMPEP_0119016510 /NCGR_PEP_ID=MMETSP1176-20130426/13320_1 /TAXON_ID=265551 /ORGANISM="Synedropsis recta cf, Strain CCMP1620" /LENGTH=229 /DNA_ID=CAMNT_0006969957 /DNA_START=57 /DNA_END=746 /DNA_ORIENTATION=+